MSGRLIIKISSPLSERRDMLRSIKDKIKLQKSVILKTTNNLNYFYNAAKKHVDLKHTMLYIDIELVEGEFSRFLILLDNFKTVIKQDLQQYKKIEGLETLETPLRLHLLILAEYQLKAKKFSDRWRYLKNRAAKSSETFISKASRFLHQRKITQKRLAQILLEGFAQFQKLEAQKRTFEELENGEKRILTEPEKKELAKLENLLKKLIELIKKLKKKYAIICANE
ncbi:MAG: hypothetical protein QF475_00795 [Candidatus Undinarchaeales archaeon]|jgi:hypothetical protein|nr:hypothetical protein [Candidatus Undinarchaeales archaeon]